MNTRTLDFNVCKWDGKYYMNGLTEKEHAVCVLMSTQNHTLLQESHFFAAS